jgi:hypothetical protein
MRDRTFLITGLAMAACLALPARAADPATPGLPATLTPEAMGKPAFEEKFNELDAGPDQTRPAHPHRWRTVYGNGGPASVANRSVGGLSLGVDRAFGGSDNGAPLGIDPFSTGPQGLTITARKADPALQPRLFGKAWTSGQLTTKFSFEQKYGYFEAEMDLPTCVKGAWPQFWLMPATGPWPLHGEIDFPETVGTGKIFWTAHSGASGRHDHTQIVSQGDCARGWHRYGVLWRPDGIGYYYDRHLVGQAPTPADFTEPMYLILDLTVGGSWPGAPDPATTQVTMRVRHVAAWPLTK